MLMRKVVSELRLRRQIAGVSQRTLAAQMGCSQSEINRLEQFSFSSVPLVRLSEIASVLGLELSVGVHPRGDPIHDKGQQPLLNRFLGIVNGAFEKTREAPFPNLNDHRSWDVLLRLDQLLCGVEAEAHLRDVQEFVRKMRGREHAGGVDEILVVLSRTAHHRRIVDQLREALGPRYATPPRLIFAALRSGQPLPGSGVILI